MIRFAFYLLCLVLGTGAAVCPTQAQPSATAEAFETTFSAWLKDNGIDKGVLAVAHGGRLVIERSYGGRDVNERVLLASLSKAITARCVGLLVANGKLRLDSTVGDVLAPFIRQHGEPADARLKAATVEQLLVHRAGFAVAPRDLMTPPAVALLEKKTPGATEPAELLAATVTAPLATAPGETFAYSNIGYLVLGVMIEIVTGESYERFCGREVLEAAGIKAPQLDTQWRSFSSFGGWRLNGAEYLAFLARTPSTLLSDARPSHAATGAPAALTPTWYALGQFTANLAPGTHIAWHTGSWGVAPDTVGMQAVQHEQSGTSWFVWYSPRPAKDATDVLLERLAALPAKITTWPERDLFPERGLAMPSAK
ncbi:MAG TPA: serine hydrolase domain-containing protein [Vineibacter sp.]|nr:serine hydrolase domain-containing protein [Vineibacter sp.]